MAKWNLAGSTAIVLFIGGTASLAEVTAEEVWQNWQDASAGYGQSMTATSTTRDGDTLVVEGLTMAMDQDGVVVNSTIDEVHFRELGDGTVEITMSDSYPVKMTFPAQPDDPEATATDLTLGISMPGMVIMASGTAGATSYEYSAPSMGIKLEAIEGVDVSAMNVTVEATMTGVEGSYLVAASEGATAIAGAFAAQSVALAVVGSDPEGQSDIRLTATMADLAGSSISNLPAGVTMEDLPAALKAGFSTEGSLSYGATAYDLNVTDAGSPTTIVGETASGNFTFAMNSNSLQFGSGSKGVSIAFTSADIPFPELKLSYAESAFNFLMPVGVTNQPANFAVLAKLVDLAVPEEMWSMFDPGAALPHDPATIVIDTKGTATITTDLMDFAAMESLGEAPPAMLNSLELTELNVKVLGAQLTGVGAFTFDNSDMETFGGMPVPTGKLDLKLVGGNALVDKLVAMGLLAEDMAMEGRMMLSIFINAGTGADEFVSRLEFKDKGFFANGMQIQ